MMAKPPPSGSFPVGIRAFAQAHFLLDKTPAKWTVGDLEKAMDFHENRHRLYRERQKHKGQTQELERTVARILESLRATQVEDQAIDLRVALETLFLAGAKGITELKYRVALNAAYDLGTTADERTKIFSEVKEAYDAGSKAIHGGPLTKDKDKEAISRGQGIVCRGIINRAKEGKTPDWDKLVLGLSDFPRA